MSVNILSDHCVVSFSLQSYALDVLCDKNGNDPYVKTVPYKYKWNNDKKSTYIDVLCSDDMNIKITNYVVILIMLKT